MLHTSNDEGEGTAFNFEAWINENGLEDVKDLFIKHDAVKPQSLSMSSKELQGLMSDPQLFGKAYLIPNIMNAVNKICQLQISNVYHVITEDEELAMEKMKRHLTELDKFDNIFCGLKRKYPQSIERIKNIKLKQIEESQSKINETFNDIKTALHSKQEMLFQQLENIKSAVNKQQNLSEGKENEIIANCIKTVRLSKNEISNQLQTCDNMIKSADSNNSDRKQRKENIKNIGAQTNAKFNKTQNRLNANKAAVQNMIDKNNNLNIRIDLLINAKTYNKILAKISNFASIVDKADNADNAQLDDEDLMIEKYKQQIAEMSNKNMTLMQELAQKMNTVKTLQKLSEQERKSRSNEKRQIIQENTKLVAENDKYKSTISKLKNDNKSLQKSRNNECNEKQRVMQENRKLVAENNKLKNEKKCVLNKCHQSLSFANDGKCKWFDSEEADEKKENISECVEIINDNPTSVKLMNGQIINNVSNNLLLASPLIHNIDDLCKYNKKLMENTEILLTKYIIQKANHFVYKYDFDFDTNGLCYALGSNFGETQWANPADKGLITLSSSGWRGRDGNNVVAREAVGRCYTKNGQNGWLCIDFKTIRIKPTKYTLRHDGCACFFLRNWQFEGSVDGSHWDLLKKHTNDTTINAAKQSHTWDISNCNKSYRMFRIYITGTNSSGSYWITCHGFEIYGLSTTQK